MIWINLSEAESLLKNGTYTNRFIFCYLLLYTVFESIVLNLGIDSLDESKWLILLDLFTVLTITILGIFYLYGINQKGDQKDFLNRYFVLSWIVMIRMALVLIPTILLLALLFRILRLDIFGGFWFEYFTLNLFGIVYYHFLGKSFKRININ